MNPSHQDWLDSLAGRSQSDPDAKATRDYFLRRIAEEENTEAQPDEMRERRMLNYLRARGAFIEQAAVQPPPGVLAKIQRGFQQFLQSMVRHPALTAGIAAALLMLPVASQLWQRGTPDIVAESQVEYRGDIAVVTLASTEPATTAGRITSILQQKQIAFRQVRKEAAWVIETKVPAEQRAAVQAAWSEWKIAIPANGIIVIEIREPHKHR